MGGGYFELRVDGLSIVGWTVVELSIVELRVDGNFANTSNIALGRGRLGNILGLGLVGLGLGWKRVWLAVVLVGC